MLPLIFWDMVLLGVDSLASLGGALVIATLALIFWALGRRFGLGVMLNCGLTGALFAGLGFMAMAGQSAWGASNTVYMMPTVLAVLVGVLLGMLALMLGRAR